MEADEWLDCFSECRGVVALFLTVKLRSSASSCFRGRSACVKEYLPERLRARRASSLRSTSESESKTLRRLELASGAKSWVEMLEAEAREVLLELSLKAAFSRLGVEGVARLVALEGVMGSGDRK